MRSGAILAALATSIVLAGGCSTSESAPTPTWEDCQSTSQAFVRRAIFALDGRRPWGQAEVNAYEDILDGTAALTGDVDQAKTFVIEALMDEDAFRLRWTDFFMDMLRVRRLNVIQEAAGYEYVQSTSCYGAPLATPVDDGSLAMWVRDNYPSATNPPIADFTMGQLVSSALQLDDVSPIYRAHLYQIVAFPLSGANVEPLDLERARREDFSNTFESAYLHRNLACLQCHNSQFSVTYSDDPAQNRWWPLPGYVEESLFQTSTASVTDDLVYRSMVRYVDVADGGGEPPYGWNAKECGSFKIPSQDDPLGIDAYFGSIHSTADDPRRGLRASVWSVDPALRRGVDLIAQHGLELDGDTVLDPDEAFASMVASTIVEKVWNEVMGFPLTVPNYFPRTSDQRDILQSLTSTFVASHFSLKQLLVAMLIHPAFNLSEPEAGCGDQPYGLPRIFNPWSNAETDPAMQGNSPADAIFAASARPLRRSLHAALEWPFAPDFPTDDEIEFQTEIGMFIQSSSPGFRGLDFQGRAAWENAYGACKNAATGDDFVTRLVARAQATPGATVGDAVLAVKDRLIGEPTIEATAEQPAIEALLGAKLTSTDLSNLDASLRLACGAYVASPQFLLAGMPPADTRDVPTLTDPTHDYAAACADAASRLQAAGSPYAVACDGDTVEVTPP